MQRAIQTAARHPWWILCLTAVLTIAAFTQLPKLQFEVSTDGMMVDDQQALAQYANSQETFGSESVTVVYLEDADLFAAEKLVAIQSALKAIDSIPEVKRTVSLFSLRYLRTIDEYVYTDPYLKQIPKKQEWAQAVKQAALNNPLVKGNLLSADGRVMAINVYFDANVQKQGLEEQLTAALNSAIEPLKPQLDRVFHFGDPSIKTGIMSQIRADQKLILPLAAFVLLVTLGLILRRPSAVIVPMMTAGLSIIWVVGLMATLGIPFNVLTAVVPALIIIVGSTEDIHLITEYQSALQRGASHRRALLLMAKHKSTAVSLTFATTCVGFLSIAFNRIDLLAEFGLVTATGLLLNFLITITLVPVCVQWCKRYAIGRPGVRSAVFENWASRISDFTFQYSQTIIEVLLGTLVVCAIWATHTEVNNNVMDYFNPASDKPQQAELLHQNLSGIQTLSVIVEGPEDSFLNVPVLQALQNLQGYINNTGKFDKSVSFADFVSVVHSGLDENPSETNTLPSKSEMLAEYMAMMGQPAAASFVSEDYSQARILIRHAIHSSTELNQAAAEILEYAEKYLDPSLEVKVTGASYLSSQASDYIISGQVRSLIIMMLMIFLLVAILFKSLKAGLVAVVANLFPIIVLFGVLGLFNIPLDTGTTMVGAISMGICIDHTIHFLMRYQYLASQELDEEKIIRKVVRLESTPIIATALALAMGFATLAFSSFPPIARFGLLSAMIMLLALISTFVIIPLMMRTYGIKLKWRGNTKVVRAHHPKRVQSLLPGEGR